MFGFIKNLFGKSEAPKEATPKMVLGMVLLKEVQAIDETKIITNLKDKWHVHIDSTDGNDSSLILKIDNQMIMVALIPASIPNGELDYSANLAYFWKNAKTEAVQHKAHIIISVLPSNHTAIDMNSLFTKVVTAILEETDALGIYLGSRTLLLPKEFYITTAELLKEGSLPLFNWAYFGMVKQGEKNSVYTYGLELFGKKEMEIIDSLHPINELQDMMYNTAHYVLDSDVTLKNGETLGISAEQKLKISLSKGKYLEGKTLKIEY
jgi:Domain of unknown function (DUF4261)